MASAPVAFASSILSVAVFRAFSGKEALEIFQHEEIAMILLDVRMPGMDGFETAQKIRVMEKGCDD